MERGEPVRTYKARRRVTPGQAEALLRLAGRYGIGLDGPLVARQLFGRDAALVLEIGSGMGEATAAMAQADPDRDLLAVEVHTPGVAALLRRVEDLGLTNLRVVEADALHVLDLVGAGSLDEVRVFFPDPWPKARHHKRRLVSGAFAERVACALRPGGRLHVATDWEHYAEQVLEVLTASPRFEVVGRDRGARPVTRFEQRGFDEGRPSYDLVAERLTDRA